MGSYAPQEMNTEQEGKANSHKATTATGQKTAGQMTPTPFRTTSKEEVVKHSECLGLAPPLRRLEGRHVMEIALFEWQQHESDRDGQVPTCPSFFSFPAGGSNGMTPSKLSSILKPAPNLHIQQHRPLSSYSLGPKVCLLTLS